MAHTANRVRRGFYLDSVALMRLSQSVSALPGVETAEGERIVPARMHFGTRWRDITIRGVPVDASLHVLLDASAGVIEPPAQGAIITSELGSRLGIRSPSRPIDYSFSHFLQS